MTKVQPGSQWLPSFKSFQRAHYSVISKHYNQGPDGFILSDTYTTIDVFSSQATFVVRETQ